MEIRITSNQMLKVLYVISWIILIGVAIEAGAFIFNTVFWLVLKPEQTRHLWEVADLSSLYHFDRGWFFVIKFLMIIVAVLRVWLFYLIVKFLHDKKLNMAQPFSRDTARFLFILSYLALVIGFFSGMAGKYVKWMVTQGVKMPTLDDLRVGGADVWLFMGVTLFVIAHIFKRGIEIQTENDLTI